MMWLKNSTDKGKAVLGFAIIAALPGILGLWFPLVYGFNDDTMLRSILSGSYTGTPDGHAVYMRYPLTGLLSLLYRISDRVPWLTLFFSGCMAICVYLIVRLTVQKIRSKGNRILCFILLSLVLALLLLRYYVLMHYTVVAALLAGTALFVLLAGGKEGFQDRSRKIGSLLLLFLSYMIRSQVFFLAMPFLFVGVLWVFLQDGGVDGRRKCLGSGGRYAAVLVAGILLFAGWNEIMYSSAEWQKYEKYNDARTQLYDYAGILPYEAFSGVYEEIGFSEIEYKALDKYETLLLDEIDAKQLEELAQKTEKIKQEQTSFRDQFTKKLQEYYYRTLHEQDFPQNGILILLYIAVVLLCIWAKKYWGLLLLVCMTGGRSIIWLYLMLKGRYPERVTTSLYLIEGLLLAGFCLYLLESRQEVPSVHNKSWKRWCTPVSMIVGILLCIQPLYQEAAEVYRLASEQEQSQQEWEELLAYMNRSEESFFYVDLYSVVSVSGRQYEANSYENYFLLGGWMTRSVLQENKQRQLGYKSALEALAEGVSVYLVLADGEDTQWFEEYFAFRNLPVTFDLYDQIGRYRIYAGNEIQEK